MLHPKLHDLDTHNSRRAREMKTLITIVGMARPTTIADTATITTSIVMSSETTGPGVMITTPCQHLFPRLPHIL
jgi:hypothetical protein